MTNRKAIFTEAHAEAKKLIKIRKNASYRDVFSESLRYFYAEARKASEKKEYILNAKKLFTKMESNVIVEKETEKAIFIVSKTANNFCEWLPKSQTEVKNGVVYVADWMIRKNKELSYFVA